MSIVGSPQQEDIWNAVAHQTENLVVKALAGTGKTTTGVEMFHRIAPPALSAPASTTTGRRVVVDELPPMCALAFNKSIATSLQAKMPRFVKSATFHSLGRYIINTTLGPAEVDADKVFNITMAFDRFMHPYNMRQVAKLTGLCKAFLINKPTESDIRDLALLFSVDIKPAAEARVIAATINAMEVSPKRLDVIDFDDMVWLPVVLDLPMKPFELLLVDEVQDLNKVQQEFAMRIAKRFVVVGDENQAIYRFRGADAASMRNLEEMLGRHPNGAMTLPLTVTRRCAQAITRNAQRFVPEFECLEDAPEGEINHDYEDLPLPGEMALCRNNAPLISYAYQMIALDKPLRIQGRDIGNGLKAFIRQLVPNPNGTTTELVQNAQEYRRVELQKLANSASATADEKREVIMDKTDCIFAISEGFELIQPVLDRIDRIFLDVTSQPKNLTLLSSVHRAKGLEADTVHIIEPSLMPSPKAKSQEDQQQEHNLQYVAYTRPRLTLNYHLG